MTDLQDIFIKKIFLQKEHYLKFFEISQLRSYEKKEYILKENSVCPFVGFVEEGIVRSFILKNGKEFNNDFYFNNSFISAYRSFVTQTPAYSNIQAMSKTTIRYITFEQLKKLEKNSDVWNKFGKYIAEQFFIRKCTRETSFLINSAEERYNSLIESQPKIEQLIPQYAIASYLRIEPESLSRIKALTYIKK
jgi:CRP-like cAMP-binding protein